MSFCHMTFISFLCKCDEVLLFISHYHQAACSQWVQMSPGNLTDFFICMCSTAWCSRKWKFSSLCFTWCSL